MFRRLRPAGLLTAGLAAAALSCGAPAPPPAPSSPQTAPAAASADFGTPEAPRFEPTLTQSNWEQWRDHVWPSADELAFEQIPWVPVLRDGVRESHGVFESRARPGANREVHAATGVSDEHNVVVHPTLAADDWEAKPM